MKALPTLLALLITVGLAGCADSAKQGQGEKGSGKKEPVKIVEPEGEPTEGTTPKVDVSDKADFAGWCTKAGETAVVKDELSKLYKLLCSGDKPTKLFEKDLLSYVYAGSGTPKVKVIEDMKSDKSTKETSYSFGVTLKLPISVEKHFTEVGPRAADEESQKQLAEVNGAQTEINVKKEYKNDGKYHVRGWLIHSKTTKKVAIISVATESDNRTDQYELEKGKLYMYTQYVDKAIQTVKTFSMLSAGVQDGDAGYIFAVVDVVVDNKGFSGEAEKQIKATATETIKAMYKAAEQVQ